MKTILSRLGIRPVHLVVGSAVALSMITGAVINELQRPAEAYCPTEDSCWVDYDGATDRWVIHEQHVDDAPTWVRD